MRRCCIVLLYLALTSTTQADDLYDYVVRCRSEPLAVCFTQLRAALDQVRRDEQGRAFCLPKVWYPAPGVSQSYPVSFIDYLLLRLSAARVTRPGDPHLIVVRDVLADIYPCRRAAR
jgi:hypothetical protein